MFCPVCHTRFAAPAGERPSQVVCPNCSATVTLQSQGGAAKTAPGEDSRHDEPPADADTYRIAADDDKPQRPAAPKGGKRVLLSCTRCGAELTPERRDRPYFVTCPECLEVVEVTPRQSRPDEPTHRSRPDRRRSRGHKRQRDSAKRDAESHKPLSPPKHVDEALAEVRREPLPPPPRWTFFTAVYSLPWRDDVRRRWALLSVGFSFLGFLIATQLWVIAAVPLWMYLVLAFFVLPMFWVTMWSGSFAGSSCLTILEDTANGNDRITGWNEGRWGDWLYDTLPVLFLAALACAAGLGIGKTVVVLTGRDAFFWPVWGVSVLLLYPVMLLSSLQAGSVWVPLTLPVLKSLIVKPWAWLTFYALSAVVVSAYVVPLVFGLKREAWFVTLILTGPLLAAVVLMEARLLGRLAWCLLVSEDSHDDAPPAENAPDDNTNVFSSGRDRTTKTLPG